MTLDAAIAELESRGVELWFEGKHLRFRGPKGALTGADRALLSGQRDAVLAWLRERAAGRSEDLPLSYGQRAIWLLDSVAPGSPVNNLVCAVGFAAPVDTDASRQALQLLLDRHQLLRATVHVDAEGVLFQRVAGIAAASVERHDARGLDEAAVRALVETERDRPFDLERGPLVRLMLVQLADDTHLQVIVLHHIVGDGMSMLMLVVELMLTWFELRGGEPAALASLRANYADYVRDEAGMLAGPQGEAMWRYWREQLADAPGALPLPVDHARPPVPSFRGGSVPLPLDPALVSRLKALARECETTPFTLLLALYAMFLAGRSGRTDVIVGTSFSERADENYEVIGDYVNALPIRARLRWGMTVREAIVQLRGTLHEAMSAQRFPVQELIERLRPERARGASPLFNCFFSLRQFPAHRELGELLSGYGDGIVQGGMELTPFRIAQQPGQFDLTLDLCWAGDDLKGSLDYALDLFDRSTVEALGTELLAFFARAVADPDDTLLPRAERDRLLETFNDTTVALDPRPFIVQFAERAAADADRCAVRFGDERIDYATQWREVERIASRLHGAGAGRGTVVGIFMARTPAMLASLLAIQRIGATYLPLDPAFPAQRLAFMAEDSGVALMLVDGERPEWLAQATAVLDPAVTQDGAAPSPLPEEGPQPEDIAYILYTSGTTGRPNGVRISHAALANYLGSMVAEPGLQPDDVLAAVSTISFDIAALELFGPLLAGAAVDLVPRATAGDGRALAERLDQAGATLLQATPSTWRLLLEADWTPPAGFRALSTGEPLPPDLAAALLGRGLELWNLYGPTETTIHSLIARVTDADAIDVGRPIANTRVYVLDVADQPVPIGTDGDVWIGGVGLAEGYHDRPEHTAERFRPDPFASSPGARMYRTGDTGRWTSQGRLVCLGRSDDQLKIRGFRIEPAEIETVLAAHAGIRRAIVVPRSVGGDVRLAAFVVHEPGAAPTSSELRTHARGALPEHMVPSIFVEIADVPQTPSGKVDRRGLPNPFVGAPARTVASAPLAGHEQTFARIWQDVLGVGAVGAEDNFFSLGGHSLLAVRAVTMFERETGHTLPPTTLYFHSLREIVAALVEADAPLDAQADGPMVEVALPRRSWLRGRLTARR